MTTTTSKHPKALRYLFFTEMWERFGYYLMIGIFLLYMKDTKAGGLGLDNRTASDIFGTFIALVYLTPFVGGMLADRWLGYRAAITIGGILMGVGYIGLAIPGYPAFYTSLFLMIIGSGFFKPNISTLLGNLYNTPEYKDNKDAGYSIFYMGINIGALICNFVAAYLRNNYGWGHAFAAAGIGMLIGVGIFWLGNKHYIGADVRKPQLAGEESLLVVLGSVLIPAAIAGVLGWFIPDNIFGSNSTDAFLFSTLPILVFYLNIWYRAEKHEKEPIAALLSIYAVVILFWAIFKQNGTALTIWAENYTDRELPTMIVPLAKSMGMVETLTNAKAKYPLYDNVFRAARDADGAVIKVDTIAPYFINAVAKIPAQGEKIQLLSTEIFQSINPFFIVLLTPVVVLFFTWLRTRKKEPTTAAKITIGLLITSISSMAMVFAVYSCHNGIEKSSPMWLVYTYAIVTIGELCLSPMGLSLVSKLAPARIAALMMGGWQLATAIGNKLSGVLASLWDDYDNKANYFWLNTALTLVAAVILLLLLRWLNRIIKQYVE